MAKVKLELAGGGDETVPAKSVIYVRRVGDRLVQFNPEAAALVVLGGGLSLPVKTSPADTAALFDAHVPMIPLSAPDNSIVYVHGAAVQDVDEAPSTLPGAQSWLVFGIGPKAPRLGVRQTRKELKKLWKEKGLDPSESGI